MNDIHMKQLEKTLTSMEVAEMVGKEHRKLMRDVRRYISQINETNLGLVDESKIALADFFRENTYKDSKGELRPCYDITKKGCEFIAHKLTGVKGTAFTAQYINRFHDMEDAIKEHQHMIGAVEIPKISESRMKLQDKIERIAGRQETTARKVTGEIMYKLGRKNNLEVAKRLYYKQYGFMPPYALDLVEFSPELTDKAHEIADEMLMKPTKEEVRREENERIFAGWGG